MKRVAVSMSLILLMALSLMAQPSGVLSSLSPAEIDRAIAAGDILKHYMLRFGSAFGGLTPGLTLGYFSTPFSRVAQAALMAKRRYKTFTAADVSPEMLAPELWVYALPYVPSGGNRGPDVRNVDAVVVMPRRARDESAAIQPIRTEVLTSDYVNLMGAKLEGRGLLAVFPLNVLSEENEVRIVYDRDWHCRRDKCRLPFKLQNVR